MYCNMYKTERSRPRQKEKHRQAENVQTKTLLSELPRGQAIADRLCTVVSDVNWLAARAHLISPHPSSTLAATGTAWSLVGWVRPIA